MKDVKIRPDQLEDFIWMSARYCIGRKTIAAAGHVDTIGDIILNNPESISKARREMLSKDIMREIADRINWRPDIYMIGNMDNFDYGWFLVEASKAEIIPGKFLDVYIEEKKVVCTIKSIGRDQYNTPFDDGYSDLIGWLKLAYALDQSRYHTITTKFEGKVEREVCIQYPIRTEDGKYEMVWCPIKMVLNRPTQQCRVAEEFIIKIE